MPVSMLSGFLGAGEVLFLFRFFVFCFLFFVCLSLEIPQHVCSPPSLAGKTTLLRHILQNTELKIGCIVNDVASVNIDAKLIRNDTRQKNGSETSTKASTADLTDTIELANGCACCSIADELFDSFENLLKVAEKRGIKYDRIVLENSGVAEPQNIRDQFNEAIMMGHPLTEKIHLDTLITVVDSATFIHDYSSRAPLAARPDLGDGGGLRPVVDLLVEQIECADFVILNKIDLLDDSTVGSLEAIIESLNPLATVMRCSHGSVPVSELLGSSAPRGIVAHLSVEGQHRGAVAAAKAQVDDHKHADHQKHADHSHDDHNHGHNHNHNHGHGHNHDHSGDCQACNHEKSREERQATTAASRFGIVSFVYERRRPFHPQRLKDLVLRWMPVSHNRTLEDDDTAAPANEHSPIRTVLRSKGFVWLSNSHTTAFYWSHAGQHFEIRDEGEWWAAVPQEDWPELEVQKQTILADFDGEGGPWGDRRQEIVFIGAGMDRDAISAQLDGALLTDDEMKTYKEQYSS